MDTSKVICIKFNSYSNTIVVIDGILFTYSYQGYVSSLISLDEIYANPSSLSELRKQGYTKFKSYIKGETERLNTFENLVDYVNKTGAQWIGFRRYLNPSDVTEFFRYEVTIQICGKHITTFYPLMDYVTTVDENIVTFLTYEGNSKAIFGKFGSEADALFGPQYPTKSAIFITDFRTTYEYRRPITDIEKIFLTKRYRDPAVIGTADDHCYNGKVEVLELDLHNPDMAVYAQMRAIDNCIEVEWRDE